MDQPQPLRQWKVNPPPNLKVSHNQTTDELIIRHSWSSPINAAGGVIIWLFIISFLMLIPFLNSEGANFCSLFLCLLLPFGLLIHTTIRGINSTTIRLKRDALLAIEHGPIPVSRGQRLATQHIEQLYVTKNVHETKKSTSYSYTLWAKLKNKAEDVKLQTNLKQPRELHYLEQVIEEFLQIEDQPVPNEWDVKHATRLGIDLAETFDLELSTADRQINLRGNKGDFQIDLTFRSLYTAPRTKLMVAISQVPRGLPPVSQQAVEQLFDVKQRGIPTKGAIRLDVTKDGLLYKQQGIPNKEAATALIELLGDLLAIQPSVVATGGELVSFLQDIHDQKSHLLSKIAEGWLRRIAYDTTQRLAGQTGNFLCADCLTHPGDFSIKLGLLEWTTYYGCRVCGQSYRLIETPGPVEAVWDRSWTEHYRRDENRVRVNCLIHQALFDFDRVVILDIDDETVERFAVQVGNDTDPLRQPRYPNMVCLVAIDCDLSPNTIKILERTFGDVKT